MSAEALKRQAASTHLWLERQGEAACGSRVGATTVHRNRVTCEHCIAGTRAADTTTDSYGSRCDERGQGRLL